MSPFIFLIEVSSSLFSLIKAVTSCPSSESDFANLEPMNPDAPVTRTFKSSLAIIF